MMAELQRGGQSKGTCGLKAHMQLLRATMVGTNGAWVASFSARSQARSAFIVGRNDQLETLHKKPQERGTARSRVVGGTSRSGGS